MGLFFVGMAVLQAWPGRGFWRGTRHGQPGSLTNMIQNMSQTPQPRFLSVLAANYGSFVPAHGFAGNLFVVIPLAWGRGAARVREAPAPGPARGGLDRASPPCLSP